MIFAIFALEVLISPIDRVISSNLRLASATASDVFSV
jgi:hypothetical protein